MGKWIERGVSNSNVVRRLQTAKCSDCNGYLITPYFDNFKHYNYCPRCGEPMKKEDEDGKMA